jgi:major membrane immunogen (membrane-anchored lipoprotein)
MKTGGRIVKKQYALLAVAALMLAGCGKLDFSQTLLHPVIPSLFSTAQGVEVVSGASTGQKTLVNGYTVDASVGAIRDKLESTTPNGYTVFNGVKGSIVSENH